MGLSSLFCYIFYTKSFAISYNLILKRLNLNTVLNLSDSWLSNTPHIYIYIYYYILWGTFSAENCTLHTIILYCKICITLILYDINFINFAPCTEVEIIKLWNLIRLLLGFQLLIIYNVCILYIKHDWFSFLSRKILIPNFRSHYIA